ncbi:MAG: DNA integrity scanning protein DisA nucleotide-binding domain protein [Malacoplasma sp.]|nr:DNA integrity scanning protein DisA nucleotide-binding domain protein [Malacoplasma sp.]
MLTAILVFVILIFIFGVFGIVFNILISNFNLARIKEDIRRKISRKKVSEQERENFIINLADALIKMSEKKTGALLVCEQRNSLSIYEDSGFKMDAKFDIEFVISIFSNKNASFHDGALIISGTNIKAISCYVPITKESHYSKHGARHRAALGISEITDSISFVVSETSGKISFAKKGELNSLGKTNEEVIENLKRLI